MRKTFPEMAALSAGIDERSVLRTSLARLSNKRRGVTSWSDTLVWADIITSWALWAAARIVKAELKAMAIHRMTARLRKHEKKRKDFATQSRLLGSDSWVSSAPGTTPRLAKK